jgi:hypothetical protein
MTRISTTSHRIARLQAISAAALIALTVLTGAAWLTITAPDDGAPLVKLERVVVEGKRASALVAEVAEVKQLPRVVVVGKRNAAADGVQVAAACVAPAVC